MPVLQTPPAVAATPTPVEGTIAADGQSVTLPATSPWLVGDTTNDTQPIHAGDLVLFKNPNGMAMLTVTSTDSTHIYFGTGSSVDWFHFNQFNVPQVPMILIKQPSDTTSAWTQKTTMFRAVMITYYVDNTTTPGTPHLMRLVNHCPASTTDCPYFAPQALAGIVEDLDLNYDLVDGVNNPANVPIAAVHRRHLRRDLQLEPDSESQYPYGCAFGGRFRNRRRTTFAITCRRRSTCEAWPAWTVMSTNTHPSLDLPPGAAGVWRTRHRHDHDDARADADVGAARRIYRRRHERSAIPLHRSRPRAVVLCGQRRRGEADRRPGQPVLHHPGADLDTNYGAHLEHADHCRRQLCGGERADRAPRQFAVDRTTAARRRRRPRPSAATAIRSCSAPTARAIRCRRR